MTRVSGKTAAVRFWPGRRGECLVRGEDSRYLFDLSGDGYRLWPASLGFWVACPNRVVVEMCRSKEHSDLGSANARSRKEPLAGNKGRSTGARVTLCMNILQLDILTGSERLTGEGR